MEFKTQISKGGRLVVPAKLRKELQIETGDEIVLRLENGSIRLIPLNQAVNLAQKLVKQYVPVGTSLVEELIQARHTEAKNE
ncbi:MAG: AbrB/MazE/SpoVT family DNA-binding domain-containing protein [Anaerolineales bacterium]